MILTVSCSLVTNSDYQYGETDAAITADGSGGTGGKGEAAEAGNDKEGGLEPEAGAEDASEAVDAVDGGGTADDSGSGVPTPGPSCDGMGLSCFDNGTPVSCCDTKLVPGGTFPMGRCGSSDAGCSDAFDGNTDELPEHSATVADFFLDTFEVTVGRFRKFVEHYNGTPPPQDAGANSLIPGSGWQTVWNSNLPADQATLISKLKCNATSQTWTDSAGAKEQYPINCVNWYEAFAFCIWDGGRLPTEAEWEYAAAGGTYNRLYPWGSEEPDGTLKRANMVNTARSPYINVGSYPDGVARWGQHDLAGSMREWALDWYDGAWYSSEAGNSCDNCANLNTASDRVLRSGTWANQAYDLRAVSRWSNPPIFRNDPIGFRCARDR